MVEQIMLRYIFSDTTQHYTKINFLYVTTGFPDAVFGKLMRISQDIPPSLSLSDGVFPMESQQSLFRSIWRTLTALEYFYKIDSLDRKLLRLAMSLCQSLPLQTQYKHHLSCNIKATICLAKKVCLSKTPICSITAPSLKCQKHWLKLLGSEDFVVLSLQIKD